MTGQEIALWGVSITATINAVAVFTMAYAMWKRADKLAASAVDLRRSFETYMRISRLPKDGEKK